MTKLHKLTTKINSSSNSNKKCGDITFCIQVGKRFYALNCLYCPQICLQWDTYINHMEEEHDDDLNFDPVFQTETNEMDYQMENAAAETEERITSLNNKILIDEFDSSAFDNPLESESSTSENCLESDIKVENVECTPNINLIDNTTESHEHIDIYKNNSDLTMGRKSLTNNQDIQTNFVDIADFNHFITEFKEHLQKTEIKIRNQIKQQPEKIKRLLVEVLEQLKLIKTNDVLRTIPKTNLIPKDPFSTIEDFLKYESEIQDNEDKYQQLIYEFEQQNASCFQNYVKLIWRKILNDVAAQHMCWKGTDRKKPVRSLTVTQALKAACNKKYCVETDLNFEKACMLHFQHAKGRHEKKLNYRSKIKQTV